MIDTSDTTSIIHSETLSFCDLERQSLELHCFSKVSGGMKAVGQLDLIVLSFSFFVKAEIFHVIQWCPALALLIDNIVIVSDF